MGPQKSVESTSKKAYRNIVVVANLALQKGKIMVSTLESLRGNMVAAEKSASWQAKFLNVSEICDTSTESRTPVKMGNHFP